MEELSSHRREEGDWESFSFNSTQSSRKKGRRAGSDHDRRPVSKRETIRVEEEVYRAGEDL